MIFFLDSFQIFYDKSMSTPSNDNHPQSLDTNNDRSPLRDPPLDTTEHIWM
jgi:hypothetical protein